MLKSSRCLQAKSKTSPGSEPPGCVQKATSVFPALQSWLPRVQKAFPSLFRASLCALPQITIFMQLFKLFVLCLPHGIRAPYSIQDNQASMPLKNKKQNKSPSQEIGFANNRGAQGGFADSLEVASRTEAQPWQEQHAVQCRDRRQPRTKQGLQAGRAPANPQVGTSSSALPGAPGTSVVLRGCRQPAGCGFPG